MIGRLRGSVDGTGEDWVILDVGGVGYLVHCSARTLGRLPGTGEAVTLSIDTHVREDMIRLYGFASEGERDWFRLLQTIQGVGAKVALAILSALDPQRLADAVAVGDKAAVAQAPGVGPKLAARIVAEMKDKAPVSVAADPGLAGVASASDADSGPSATRDAVSALANLGYGRAEAAAAVAAAIKTGPEGADARTLIRLGLRELAR